MPDYGELLYYKGARLKIVFAMTSGGDTPGKDFFLKDTKPPAWGKLDRILKRLGDFGVINNIEQFRPVGNGLHEVKEGGGRRLVGYFLPGHFIITHGFHKRGGGKSANKFPDTERERALGIRAGFEPHFQRIIRSGQ